IRGVRCIARGIADRSRVNTALLPEAPFGAPEATHPKYNLLHLLRKWRQQRCAFNCMTIRDGQSLRSPRECFFARWKCGFCQGKHSKPPAQKFAQIKTNGCAAHA